MLPYSCIDSILYTHELNVYYSVQSQGTYGNVTRTWVFDRIERGMVKPVKTRMYVVDNQNTWNEQLTGHSEEDLRIDSEGGLHAPSEVLITFSAPHFVETAGARKGLPTTYELRSSAPIEGPFGEVLHFDILLERSIEQNQTGL